MFDFLGCVWKGRPAQLVIHYENGFTLLEGGTGSRTLWRYPFDRLKNSSDDGKRYLWLDFGSGEETEVVRINGHHKFPDHDHTLISKSSWNFDQIIQWFVSHKKVNGDLPPRSPYISPFDVFYEGWQTPIPSFIWLIAKLNPFIFNINLESIFLPLQSSLLTNQLPIFE